jgi:hypothetical protein
MIRGSGKISLVRYFGELRNQPELMAVFGHVKKGPYLCFQQ